MHSKWLGGCDQVELDHAFVEASTHQWHDQSTLQQQLSCYTGTQIRQVRWFEEQACMKMMPVLAALMACAAMTLPLTAELGPTIWLQLTK